MKSFLIAALLLTTQVARAQGVLVRRSDGSETSLSSVDIAGLPVERFEAVDHGRATRFQGVPLRALLLRAGAGPVDSLRGASLRRVVVAHGADGYRAVLALAELDGSLAAHRAFVVTSADGAPLPAAQGPYRLVVPGDGRAARWVRQLVRIDVIEVP